MERGVEATDLDSLGEQIPCKVDDLEILRLMERGQWDQFAQPFDNPIMQCIMRRCARQFCMRSGEVVRSNRPANGKSIA